MMLLKEVKSITAGLCDVTKAERSFQDAPSWSIACGESLHTDFDSYGLS